MYIGNWTLNKFILLLLYVLPDLVNLTKKQNTKDTAMKISPSSY